MCFYISKLLIPHLGRMRAAHLRSTGGVVSKLATGLENRVLHVEALAALGQRALVALDVRLLLADAASTVALTLEVDLVEVLEALPDGTVRRQFTGAPGADA